MIYYKYFLALIWLKSNFLLFNLVQIYLLRTRNKNTIQNTRLWWLQIKEMVVPNYVIPNIYVPYIQTKKCLQIVQIMEKYHPRCLTYLPIPTGILTARLLVRVSNSKNILHGMRVHRTWCKRKNVWRPDWAFVCRIWAGNKLIAQ